MDTTYLIPIFGIETDIASNEEIKTTLKAYIDSGGELGINTLSAIEGYGKAIRIAEKADVKGGFLSAAQGFIDLLSDKTFHHYEFRDFSIFNWAQQLRRKHRDLFDCFIFATALAKKKVLLTEDTFAHDEIKTIKVWNWKTFKGKLMDSGVELEQRFQSK
ncbi:MAG: hypothetical protein ACXADX_19205 [Candidatus Hodarchaeales archaeon]